MTEDQQEELLIRIDERAETICKWIIEHKEQHKDEKSQVRRYLYLAWASIIGIIIKMSFWN